MDFPGLVPSVCACFPLMFQLNKNFDSLSKEYPGFFQRKAYCPNSGLRPEITN